MRCLPLEVVGAVLLCVVFHTTRAEHASQGCKDVGIWIASGMAECNLLERPSAYGLHRKPGYYCTNYSQTDCCATCTRMGYLATTPSSVTTEAPPITTAVTGDVCRDKGIWYGDGLVACDRLEVPSGYGLHKRPRYFCTNYSQTQCCETCTRLGYLTPGNASTPTTVATETPSISVTTIPSTTTVRQTTRPAGPMCRDKGIWIADGLISCDLLERSSAYGFHRRPEYFCSTYSQTSCCETCTRLGFLATDSTPTPATVAMETTTTSTTTAQPTTPPYLVKIVPLHTTKTAKKCKDAGILFGNRLLPCRHLEEASGWQIHTRPLYYCHAYPLTDCCETCGKIDRRRFQFDKNAFAGTADWYRGLWTLLSNN